MGIGDIFGSDGKFIKFSESLPGVGYVVSAGHGITALVTGNDEHKQRARRACASSTKSLISTGSTILGGALGGPAGAVAGAAYGSLQGQLIEKTINESIDDKYQTSSGNLSNLNPVKVIGEVVIDTAFAGLDAGVISGVGKRASRKVVGRSLKQAGGGGMKRYIKKRAIEKAISSPFSASQGAATDKLRKL